MAKRDNHKAARVLVEAHLLRNDAKVAEKHGIALRTLQNYRAAMSEDLELSRLFVDFLRGAEHQGWLEQLDRGLALVIKKIMDGLEAFDPENLGDVERLATILDSLAEIKLSRDMYGVDSKGEEAAGEGASGETRASGAGATPSLSN